MPRRRYRSYYSRRIRQLLRQALGTKIKDESELRKRYKLPVLALIPDFNEAIRNSSKYSYTDYYVRGENK